jgi:NACalpha-BTF3-like transcription factor
MIDPISAISGSMATAKETYDFLNFVRGIASSGINVTISPDYLLDGLTATYVVLTLVLAIIALRSLSKTQTSLDLTRQQININKQQSQEALEASERHSQATIEAVNKQIEASERQAKEALFNQHKPVIVPLDRLISNDESIS